LKVSRLRGQPRHAVAVVHRDRVVEQRTRRGVGGAGTPPLHQRLVVGIDRRVVEGAHRHARAAGHLQRHAGRAEAALFAQLLREVVEVAVVVQQCGGFVAGLRQVAEQRAARRCAFVQRFVRHLAAAGAQQSQQRRAAVRGRAVELREQDVEALHQRRVTHAHFVQVVPRQRTDAQHDDVEPRRGAGGQRHRLVALGVVETFEPRVQLAGRRRGTQIGRLVACVQRRRRARAARPEAGRG